MAENTEISWADDTFNPWEGCQKVSPACDACYAEARNLRYAPKGSTAAPNWGPGAPRRRTSEANWAKPLKWEKEQAAKVKAWREGPSFPQVLPIAKPPTGPRPERFVFCASLADVFDNAVDPAWRHDLFDLIRQTPHLTWLLLTKRPGNIVKLFTEALSEADKFMLVDPPLMSLADCWPRNAAIGCTVENQEVADRDIPKLLAAKAALNPAFAFVSMEPLLRAVDLTSLDINGDGEMDALSPRRWGTELDQWRGSADTWEEDFMEWFGLGLMPDPAAIMHPTLDWVITGGETDQGKRKARPSHPDWFRSLRDQCAAAGVAYHHKQNGEFFEPYWDEDEEVEAGSESADAYLAGLKSPALITPDGRTFAPHLKLPADTPARLLDRVGKRAAGRLLDGVEHNARPEPRTP